MTAVKWSPNLSVGSEEIDREHEDLIALLNNLAANVEAGMGAEAVKGCLDKLLDHTEQHFRHEEAIMARAEYPDLDHHHRLHEALMEEIREFRKELDGGTDIGPEVTDFIKTWLISHIMESDKQLGGYLQGRAAALSEEPAGVGEGGLARSICRAIAESTLAGCITRRLALCGGTHSGHTKGLLIS